MIKHHTASSRKRIGQTIYDIVLLAKPSGWSFDRPSKMDYQGICERLEADTYKATDISSGTRLIRKP